MAGRDEYAGLQVRCVEVKRGARGWGTISSFEHADYRQMKEYVDVVGELGDAKFDRVLIDGRARKLFHVAFS